MTAQIAAYGRLVDDPQVKQTSKGTPMTLARMAVPLPCSQADDGTATMWLTGHNSRKDPTTPDYQSDGGTMTEAELLGLIRRVTGISQQHDEQATQPDSVTAENYARVVAEVMRRDGIQLNDVDMRNIRIRVLEMLAYNRRVALYRETEKITYHWKKPERLRR